MESDTEERLLAESLLAAAACHDLEAVRNLIKSVSANIRDPETKFTPLHAAVAGAPELQSSKSKAMQTHRDSDSSIIKSKQPLESLLDFENQAIEIVNVLFENGAIWNDVDASNETAACIAWRLGLKRVYDIIVAAGVRAEILLNLLEEMSGEDEDSEENEGPSHNSSDQTEDMDPFAGIERTPAPLDSTDKDCLKSPEAATSHGQEISRLEPSADYIDHWNSNPAFLRSSLRFSPTQLLDSSSNAVMMDWEDELMRRHADRLLPQSGLRVLNIGHGMGIVDAAIQTHNPSLHHIVEAHPAVLGKMRENGWFEKPGVQVHEGRWQDVLPQLIEQGVEVDAIYYDTFAEDYKDFKELFTEHVIGLLEQHGRFAFYNGLGADRRVCYDVYTSVAEMDLLEAGFRTTWEELTIPEIEWDGVRRPYWDIDFYRLPTCTYL